MPAAVENNTLVGPVPKIVGRLVTKRIFTSRKSGTFRALCCLTILTPKGNLIDIQVWSSPPGQKAFCIYRKAHIDSYIKITDIENLKAPDPKYSNSNYVSVNGHWWLDEEDDEEELDLKKFVPCSTDLEKAIKCIRDRGTANVLAIFLAIHRGPGKHYNQEGRPSVQGYYLELVDECGKKFYVLVWHATRIDKGRYDILNCNVGQSVLITNCRPSIPPTNKNGGKLENRYTLTSLSTPAIDSDCISVNRILDLKRKFQNR